MRSATTLALTATPPLTAAVSTTCAAAVTTPTSASHLLWFGLH